jgi:hypothetical protein
MEVRSDVGCANEHLKRQDEQRLKYVERRFKHTVSVSCMKRRL